MCIVMGLLHVHASDWRVNFMSTMSQRRRLHDVEIALKTAAIVCLSVCLSVSPRVRLYERLRN